MHQNEKKKNNNLSDPIDFCATFKFPWNHVALCEEQISIWVFIYC